MLQAPPRRERRADTPPHFPGARSDMPEPASASEISGIGSAKCGDGWFEVLSGTVKT